MTYIQYFNIHNLITFSIEGTNKRIINHIEKEFAFFKTDEHINPDIKVIVTDFIPELKNCYFINSQYYIKDNYLYCEDRQKFVEWKLCIKNISTKPVIYFNGNLFSELFLRDYILDPLISYKLCQHGIFFLHASSISIEGKGFVFTGPPRVGKTSLSLYLAEKNNSFLSDEISIISSKGIVYSYPSPIRIYYDNLKCNKNLYKKMPLNEKFMLNLKNIIQKLSLNYIKIPHFIFAEKCFDIVGKKIPIYSIYLLSITNKDNTNLLQDINKEQFINSLVQINKQQFYRFSEYLSAYSFINPKFDIKTYWSTMESNIRECLNLINYFELEIPSSFKCSSFEECYKILHDME